MSLADHLAQKYLNADPRPEKKAKKRKRKAEGTGLVIADDDARGWERDGPDAGDDDGPVLVGHQSAEFRKAKKNNWKTLAGAPATLPASTTDAVDAAAADAILADAAAENKARAAAAEDAPVVLDEDGDDGDTTAAGGRTGLQTGAQFAAAQKRQAAAERARLAADSSALGGAEAETIYRDASGRIVNVAMKRAEARAAAEAAAARAAQAEEDAKGDVQRVERDRRRQDLRDAKYMTVARYADDRELNAELRERQRWDDPAAQFMAAAPTQPSATGRPLYAGHAPPNRYGIRPGAQWDGVDRGTGFEAEWFKARNRQTRLQTLDYAWQTDE